MFYGFLCRVINMSTSSGHCNSFEDHVPIDEFYWYPIVKSAAMGLLPDT